jgi:hypothetical protein
MVERRSALRPVAHPREARLFRSPLRALIASLVPLAALSSCGAEPLVEPAGPPKPPGGGFGSSDAGLQLIAPDANAPDSTSSAAPATDPDSTEGMWLLNDFPSEKLGKRFGFAPTKEWLDHVRLSSVRLARGCSGSIVSPNGLVMTNHHCAHHCIEQLSSAKKDFVASGFYAKTPADEVKCPDVEVNELVDISDVTDRVTSATKGLADREFAEKQKAAIAEIEKACATGDDVRCDVVSLYHGGRYHLYKYKRFQDVRLVFAPEFSVAFFGGDPDNFMFPRYDLDVSFLRIYENGKPLETKNHFGWSPSGPKEGDLTFVSGNPGSTSRNLTVAELAYIRDVALPTRLLRLAEMRGLMTEFQARGPEQKRISNATLFGIENAFKALKGRQAALLDPELFGAKERAERELRAKVEADPAMKAKYAAAWDAIARAEQRMREIRVPYQQLEQGLGFWSDLFDDARSIVRAADELPKPNEKRLREFGDSHLPAVKQELFSTAPIYDELEILKLTHSLTKLREELGPDDPVVAKVLGARSPAEVATALVHGTKLKDPKVRKALFDGGKPAVDASKDPMILLAKSIDADARAVRTTYEDEVEGVVKKNDELVARAKFDLYGTSVYPDATFTLRLSYGVVKGWDENGKHVSPFTTMGGAFARATGQDPFALPKSWIAAKSKLNLATPLDFCTTNDIIGGNSGSPVIDQDARIVGLIFDGNIHSLGGDYAFDPKMNRAVAVDSAALLEALDKVYGASRIVADLRAGSGP